MIFRCFDSSTAHFYTLSRTTNGIKIFSVKKRKTKTENLSENSTSSNAKLTCVASKRTKKLLVKMCSERCEHHSQSKVEKLKSERKPPPRVQKYKSVLYM